MRRKAHPGGTGPRAFLLQAAGVSALLMAGVGVTLSGCGTGGLAVKRDVWDAQEGFERRQAGLSEKVLTLEGRLAAVEEGVAAIRYQLDELSTQLASSENEFARGLEAVRDGQQQLGVELEGRISSVDAGRASDREDLVERMEIILDEVTRENRDLREELQEIRSSVSVGYEHVVKRGETLARIAAEYGVTVADIIAANDIDNPNLISVGRKLIVPGR
jgi:nucleoid-associated protein YgaU